MLRSALQHPCAIAQEQAESKLAKASDLSTADEIAKALHLTISLCISLLEAAPSTLPSYTVAFLDTRQLKLTDSKVEQVLISLEPLFGGEDREHYCLAPF